MVDVQNDQRHQLQPLQQRMPREDIQPCPTSMVMNIVTDSLYPVMVMMSLGSVQDLAIAKKDQISQICIDRQRSSLRLNRTCDVSNFLGV